MPINPEKLLSWSFPVTTHSYDSKDAILYALGVGLGADPTNAAELRFVYEQDLVVLPTMAAVLGHPGPWYADPRTGIDWVHVVQGEQSLLLHAPLAAADTVTCQAEVTDVEDKGPGRGALVRWQRTLRRASTGDLLATSRSVLFCRGDGGFGGRRRASAPAEPWPDEPPTATVTRPISPRAALIYRLSGDSNPVHADPRVAIRAGYPRPILHGLCTFAMAVCGLLSAAGCDTGALRSARVRFRAPAFPGETLRTDIWISGGTARFRSMSLEREQIVLDAGAAEVEGEWAIDV